MKLQANLGGYYIMRNQMKTLALAALLFIGVAGLYGCSKKESQRLASAGPPMTPYVHFEYAVYMMPVHTKDPDSVIRRALSTQFPKLKLVNELPSEPREIMFKAQKKQEFQNEYAPPSTNSLQYSGHGLSDKEMNELQKTKEVFILDFAHPKESVWTALHIADELVEEVARETGGLVWDEETREVYSPDAWHKQRIGQWEGGIPNISTQTVIHLYENGEFLRAISLGMTKAGLPDVAVEELPEISGDQVAILINLFAQSMAEGRTFRENGEFRLDMRGIRDAGLRDRQVKSLRPNGTGVVCLTLKEARPEEGDPRNRIIELAFDRYVGNGKHAKQEAALSWFFGWEDTIRNNVEHTAELLEESGKEKAKLPELHLDFDKGLLPGEYILVKAPFDTQDGGKEWMWVEIRKWKRHVITGALENQPQNIPNLHDGQIVDVQERDVFDYIRHYPDGHQDGNTTGAMIEKMGQETNESKTKAMSPPPKCE